MGYGGGTASGSRAGDQVFREIVSRVGCYRTRRPQTCAEQMAAAYTQTEAAGRPLK